MLPRCRPALTRYSSSKSLTKLDYDVRVKGPLYARHGVPEYWILDLPARALRRFRKPRSDKYTDVSAFETPDIIALPGLQGTRVDLAGVL